MSNPYIQAGSREPIVGNKDVALQGKTSKGTVVASGTPLVGSNGEFNASDNQELMAAITQALQARQDGSIIQQDTVEDKQAMQAYRRQAAEHLRASYFDTTGSDFSIIGEEIANTVRDTASRAGFMRRFLNERELVAGEVAKIRMRRHQINAFSLGPHSDTVESRHDGRFMFPNEETISARPTINEKDLYSEGMGLLDEKSDEALEASMVQEDRGMKNLFDRAVETSGQSLMFPTFTPTVFADLKQRVVNTGGIPVEDCWISNNLWIDITGSNEFGNWFDPISKHELVMTGRVGRLMDTNLHTDTFLESRLRVLNPGEVYFVGRSDYLGEVLVRQPMTSSEISGANDGAAWRGWFMREILAVGIANNGAVSYGRKI